MQGGPKRKTLSRIINISFELVSEGAMTSLTISICDVYCYVVGQTYFVMSQVTNR